MDFFQSCQIGWARRLTLELFRLKSNGRVPPNSTYQQFIQLGFALHWCTRQCSIKLSHRIHKRSNWILVALIRYGNIFRMNHNVSVRYWPSVDRHFERGCRRITRSNILVNWNFEAGHFLFWFSSPQNPRFQKNHLLFLDRNHRCAAMKQRKSNKIKRMRLFIWVAVAASWWRPRQSGRRLRKLAKAVTELDIIIIAVVTTHFATQILKMVSSHIISNRNFRKRKKFCLEKFMRLSSLFALCHSHSHANRTNAIWI